MLPSNSLVRNSLNVERAKALREQQEKFRIVREQYGTEYADLCGSIVILTNQEGWKFVESKLMAMANPHNCLDSNGNYDPGKLRASKMALDLLDDIEGMKNFHKRSKNEGN